MHCTKIAPEFECQGQRSRSPGTKMKNCWVIPVGRTQQTAADDTIAWQPGVTGYAGGKISACCLVVKVIINYAWQLRYIDWSRLNEDQERYFKANSLFSSGRQILSADRENGQNLVWIFPTARHSQLQCSKWYNLNKLILSSNLKSLLNLVRSAVT